MGANVNLKVCLLVEGLVAVGDVALVAFSWFLANFWLLLFQREFVDYQNNGL